MSISIPIVIISSSFFIWDVTQHQQKDRQEFVQKLVKDAKQVRLKMNRKEEWYGTMKGRRSRWIVSIFRCSSWDSSSSFLYWELYSWLLSSSVFILFEYYESIRRENIQRDIRSSPLPIGEHSKRYLSFFHFTFSLHECCLKYLNIFLNFRWNSIAIFAFLRSSNTKMNWRELDCYSHSEICRLVLYRCRISSRFYHMLNVN